MHRRESLSIQKRQELSNIARSCPAQKLNYWKSKALAVRARNHRYHHHYHQQAFRGRAEPQYSYDRMIDCRSNYLRYGVCRPICLVQYDQAWNDNEERYDWSQKIFNEKGGKREKNMKGDATEVDKSIPAWLQSCNVSIDNEKTLESERTSDWWATNNDSATKMRRKCSAKYAKCAAREKKRSRALMAK